MGERTEPSNNRLVLLTVILANKILVLKQAGDQCDTAPAQIILGLKIAITAELVIQIGT